MVNPMMKSTENAAAIRKCATLLAATVMLNEILAEMSAYAVELHKKRVREVLGIPEGVPCSGE